MQASRNSWHEDFDMAKLQKSLKQQQQRSRRMEHTVTKLTAAEVRSLNNSVAMQKTASNPPSSYIAPKILTNTPPLTPDNVNPNHRSSSNRNSVSLPTPPQSPDDILPQRQNSNPRNSMHILSPIPQSYGRPGFVLAANNSRPPSASSYRNIPTYRGPELTNNNSMSMLQPSSMTYHIVDNPLSQFSRPRQSRGSISPARQEVGQSTSRRTSDARSQRSQSFSMLDTTEEQSVSSLHRTESSVSACEAETEQEPSVPPTEPVETTLQRTRSVTEEPRHSTESRSRFSWGWRRQSNSQRNDSDDGAEGNKTRRRTISWSRGSKDAMATTANEKTRTDLPLERKDTLVGESPSAKIHDYGTGQERKQIHVADANVNSLSQPTASHLEDQPSLMEPANLDEEEVESSHDVLADDTVPMYSRCACCGKLKKPAGNRSLSPVPENEKSRSDMSGQIQQSEIANSDQIRSGSSSQPKDTPIISIPAEDLVSMLNRSRPHQKFSEELYDFTPIVNERGDIIAAGNSPVMLAPVSVEDNEKRLIRFSSLYFKDGTQQRANIAKRIQSDGSTRKHTDMRRRAQTSPNEYSSISGLQNLNQQHQQEKGCYTDTVKDNSVDLIVNSPGPVQAANDSGSNVATSAIEVPPRNNRRYSDRLEHAEMRSSQQQRPVDSEMISLPSDKVVQASIIPRPHTDVNDPSKNAALTPQIANTSDISFNRSLDSGLQRPQANYYPTMITQDESVMTQIEYPSRAPTIKPRSPARQAFYAKHIGQNNDTIQTPALEGAPRSETIMLAQTIDSNHDVTDSENTESSREQDTTIYDESSASMKLSHKSPEFDLLPLPQLGNHFEESIAFLTYSLSSGNGSNLVESVLAATNANHCSNDDDLGRF